MTRQFTLRLARAVVFALFAALLAALETQAAENASDADQDATTEQAQAAPAQKPPEAGAVEIPESAGTVTGALQGQEGVRIQTMCTHCNSANIQVGGLSADLAPLTYGGYPVIGGLATSYLMNMLPSDFVSEAQVTRGPAEATVPAPAAGGVIDLTAATPAELPWADLIVERGSFQLQKDTLRFAGPVTRWLSGILTAGQENVEPVDSDGDGFNDVTSVDRQIGDARVVLAPNKNHSIDLGYSRIEEDDLEGKGAFDFERWLVEYGADPLQYTWVREDAAVRRNEYRAGWSWRLPSAGLLTVRGLQADRDQSIFSQDTALPGPGSEFFERYKIEEQDRWAALQLSQPIGLDWRVDAGVETEEVRVRAIALVSSGARSQDSEDKVETRAVYLSAGYTPSTHWDFVGGLRYDRVDISGITTNYFPFPRTTDAEDLRSRFSPRFTVKYRPSESWTIRATSGKTIRAAEPIFTEVCCGRRYISNAEAGVRAETATTNALESIYQPSHRFKASAYVAQTEFKDFVQQLVSYSFAYQQIYANTNIADARAKTAELAAQWTPSDRVRFDASIGWLSFFNTGDPLVPIVYVPFSQTTPTEGLVLVDRLPNRPIRSGAAGVSFTLPGQATLSVQATYTGPQVIQQWDFFNFEAPSLNGLRPEMRSIGGFWLTNISATAPLGRFIELTGSVDNFGDYVQFDLGDPTRDYNWGPLTGITARVAVRLHLDRDSRGGAH